MNNLLEIFKTSAPIATIITTIIGATKIFFTILYSARRSAKISLAKIRLDWIESLRRHLCEFQSMAMQPDFKFHTDRKLYQRDTRTKSRLNPEETTPKKLITEMYKMLGVSDGITKEKYAANPEFTELSQKIIISEWDRFRKAMR